MLCLEVGCSSLPEIEKISPVEQLKLDSQKTRNLLVQFEKRERFQKSVQVESYLNRLAKTISIQNPNFSQESIQVRIHRDEQIELRKSFSFPGILISIPRSILKSIEFENELAALIALELAHLDRRWLAIALDRQSDSTSPQSFQDLFRFSKVEFQESIGLGIRMMYAAGYDPRGMVALFEKFSSFYVDLKSEDGLKNQQAYIRYAQKSKNEHLPSSQPIVRSNEFLKMKKELKGLL